MVGEEFRNQDEDPAFDDVGAVFEQTEEDHAHRTFDVAGDSFASSSWD